MTLTGLGIANVVLAPLALGFALVAAMRLRSDRWFTLGFAQLAGALALAALYFTWLACGLPLVAFRYVPVPLGLALCFALRKRFGTTAVVARPGGSRAADIALCAVLALVVAFAVDHALRGSTMLALVGDEANIWALKANAIFVEGGFNEGLFRRFAPPLEVFHADYPLLNPMLQLFTFANADGLLHVGNRIPIFQCVVGLLLILASALRRAAHPWLAPALLLLVGGCDSFIEECENAASDGLVAFGLLAALECRARARAAAAQGAEATRPWLCAFALALAFLAWSKNEGMMLAACVVAGVLVGERGSRAPLGLRRIAVALVPCAAIVAAQLAFNARFGLHNDLVGNPNVPSILTRIATQGASHAGPVLQSAWDWVVGQPMRTNLLPALCILLVLLAPFRAWTRARAYVVALALGFAGFFLIYLGTPHDIGWHLKWSIERILFQLTPACALVVGLLGRETRRA